MQPEDFLRTILKDLSVELTEEFDKNFERQAFFDKLWPIVKGRNGNILNVHGGAGLRGSIMNSFGGNQIIYTSSKPYAIIHNEGGAITVTKKMKGYFWYRYRMATGGMSTRKDGAARNNKSNRILAEQAQLFKALALMKVGSKIKIPERRYIGHHKQVDMCVERVVDSAVTELGQHFEMQFKKIK
jgi:phage gpG-like protein